MAHLGALLAFEEEKISFSVVTGTSIGAIVGALYASGYSATEMKRIVAGLNVKEFKRRSVTFSDLSFAEEILSGYLTGNIEDLPKPFAAWATSADDNSGVLLDRGSVIKAVTASSAVPPYFRSVDFQGKKLYDGAYTNSVPADVAKDLGADVVIGIDLSAYFTPDEEKTTFSRLLGSAIKVFDPMVKTPDCKTRGYAAADLMLRPMLRGYRASDVTPSAMENMFELGYREAVFEMKRIKKIMGER